MATEKQQNEADFSRRSFLESSARLGAGIAVLGSGLGRSGWAKETVPAGGTDALHVALIGAGAQGRVLMESCLRIPGIRFQAVCDMWDYALGNAQRYLKKYGHEANAYEDYREMLAKEEGLDAVIVATPDWVHHEHSIACMEAGLDVYCEKEMSNSLEKARQMVFAARKTGRVMQIGHQRRSNPRYLHAIDRIIRDLSLLGRVTHANAQWNRAKSEDIGWPRKHQIPAEKLARYGYASMSEFRNWRWYKSYGGGPVVDLGSHQIDLFSWVFGVNPHAVTASGGINFYEHHEWYDNVMAVYEFENEQGVARAFYQVLTTTKHGGFYETFMGEDGTLIISEVPQRGNAVEREAHAEPWEPYVKSGDLNRLTKPIQRTDTKQTVLDVRVTLDAGKWPLPIDLAKPAHQPHLENFFLAVRRQDRSLLTCPPELGYETAVAVLAANKAVEAQKRLTFKPEDFHA